MEIIALGVLNILTILNYIYLLLFKKRVLHVSLKSRKKLEIYKNQEKGNMIKHKYKELQEREHNIKSKKTSNKENPKGIESRENNTKEFEAKYKERQVKETSSRETRRGRPL